MKLVITDGGVLGHCKEGNSAGELLIDGPGVDGLAEVVAGHVHLVVAHLRPEVHEVLEAEDGQEEDQLGELPPAVLEPQHEAHHRVDNDEHLGLALVLDQLLHHLLTLLLFPTHHVVGLPYRTNHLRQVVNENFVRKHQRPDVVEQGGEEGALDEDLRDGQPAHFVHAADGVEQVDPNRQEHKIFSPLLLNGQVEEAQHEGSSADEVDVEGEAGIGLAVDSRLRGIRAAGSFEGEVSVGGAGRPEVTPATFPHSIIRLIIIPQYDPNQRVQ